jgi:hypothetical protein
MLPRRLPTSRESFRVREESVERYVSPLGNRPRKGREVDGCEGSQGGRRRGGKRGEEEEETCRWSR